jgi:hypothetical protein
MADVKGFLKGLVSKAPALPKLPLQRYAAIDASKVSQDFNPSGFLKGTSKPVKKQV